MKYEITLRIDDGKPVEIPYIAIFLKEAIYSNPEALNHHLRCVALGREGRPLSEILRPMYDMVVALERDENDSRNSG